MDFIYLFRILAKRKWIIIGAAVLAALVAYLLTGNDSKEYRSTSQVSTGFTVSDEIKLNENFSFYEAETKFENAIVTFTSPSVISLLSYNLILHDLTSPTPFKTFSEEEKKSTLFKSVDLEDAKRIFQNRLESMNLLTSYKPEEKNLIELLNAYGYDYKTITKNLNVYRLKRTDYIQFDYVSPNPELSAFVVNNIFQQFIRYYGTIRSSQSAESIDTLRSIMVKKKQVLDDKNAVLRKSGIVDVDLQSTSSLDIIAGLEESLTQQKIKQTQLNADLRKIRQRIANAGSPTVDVPNYSNNEELINLRREMNEANSAYIATGSTDRVLLAKYNTLREAYNKKMASQSATTRTSPRVQVDRAELQAQENDIEVDIQEGNKSISSIQSNINQLKGSVSSTASTGAVIESLKKEADLADKEYIEAKTKYNDATDNNSSSVNNYKQITLGQPALEPEPSKRKLIVAMAGIAAMITTILIIIFLVYLDSSVKTPSIFSKTVNLKLISMVNFMDMKQKRLEDIVANKDGSDDATDKKRHNVFRESIRKLRYEVESSGKKTFLFTSTKKGQGKTTLIQALSYSMSLSKKKILIIDTNFCNNDLTLLMNADPILEKITPGKMVDSKALLRHVKSVSKDAGVGTVFVIGSEGGDYTPSEILPRENLLHHLNALTAEFDYIFLEGPPLNDFSDSKELAQYVEGVIAVFSASEIIKQTDKESIAFFKELNGKFCGSILNKVELDNVNVA